MTDEAPSISGTDIPDPANNTVAAKLTELRRGKLALSRLTVGEIKELARTLLDLNRADVIRSPRSK